MDNKSYGNILQDLKDESFISMINNLFIVGQPKIDINLMIWPDYESIGIRLIEIEMGPSDIRQFSFFNNRKWIVDAELFDGMYNHHIFGKNGKWDMTSDGDFLCYRWSLSTYILYKVEKIHKVEIEWMSIKSLTDTQELTVRNELKPILTELLIQKMMHIQRVFSGEFEVKYGIHFKLVQIAEHQRIRYKPDYPNVEWINSGTLGWGDATSGWSITSDLTIACCRVKYDEYFYFRIEVLNETQIEYYKEVTQM
jgi:hypothetical protein